MAPTTISEVRATEAALGKLGARPSERRTLIGRTDGGRVLTLVVEETLEPTSWLIITGWTATERERKLLDRG